MAILIKDLLDDYCVLDLETTGFSTDYNEIIEVGILKVRNNKIINTYQQLIHPNYNIPYYITQLTGITNNMVAKCPYIHEIENEILNFIDNDIILGHNTNFDVRFLNAKINANIMYYLDTRSFSKKAFPGLIDYKLTTLRNYLNLSVNNHRSLADCYTTKELYDIVKDKIIRENIRLK